MFSFLKNLLPTSNERAIAKYKNTLIQINSLEPEFEKLSNDQLRNKTEEFKTRIANGISIDDLLPEAFAAVREASKRVLKMRHFDVQIIGGIVIHEGKISEMKTGEGKTLVATLPSYLNALSGKPVHIITVNDYLAHRDASQMSKLYEFLGLSCGCITSDVDNHQRAEIYQKSIIYVTNNEIGFDYLRDNMRHDINNTCLLVHGFHFAIVDEVDSILIDEARTPLIISGNAGMTSDLYKVANDVVTRLTKSAYELDEKHRSATLTDEGYSDVESFMKKSGIIGQNDSLFHAEDHAKHMKNTHIIHSVNQALKAHKVFKEGTDYMVRSGEVLIVDEFTGRIMDGRRYSEGLHQALEAKHRVQIHPETQTFASITYQNYFRMYEKLAGMTGTAQTEANEFREIYGLSVVSIPTHMPVSRVDENDVVYRTEREKFEAITKLAKDVHEKNQPVLIGTTSVKKSEKLSEYFTRAGLKHNVLNAKYHEKEADIIADAGRLRAITIATNMAGRGTDISLGGNLAKRIAKSVKNTNDENEIAKITAEHTDESTKVKEAGGLFIIGSERHESRRIDNQLRGRSGRQGDAGKSQFFMSLEDDLLRIFGGQKIDAVLARFGFKEGESMNHPWLDRVIRKAQERIESHHFDMRKNVLKYDDIMNTQRNVIYGLRSEMMHENFDVKNSIREMIINQIQDMEKSIANEDLMEHALAEFETTFGFTYKDGLLMQKYDSVSITFEDQKTIMFDILDSLWKEHLYTLDCLRSEVHLRSYAQKDPLNEYRIEAFKQFDELFTSYHKICIKEIITHARI